MKFLDIYYYLIITWINYIIQDIWSYFVLAIFSLRLIWSRPEFQKSKQQTDANC